MRRSPSAAFPPRLAPVPPVSWRIPSFRCACGNPDAVLSSRLRYWSGTSCHRIVSLNRFSTHVISAGAVRRRTSVPSQPPFGARSFTPCASRCGDRSKSWGWELRGSVRKRSFKCARFAAKLALCGSTGGSGGATLHLCIRQSWTHLAIRIDHEIGMHRAGQENHKPSYGFWVPFIGIVGAATANQTRCVS